MGRRVGRPRASEGGLSRERILTEALRLVDEAGVEGMSMRRLAGALGVDPMAIYRHLDGKEAVLAGVIELVFAEMRVRPTSAGWRAEVIAVAEAYRELARAHPSLVLHLIADGGWGVEAVLAANERLYAALERASLAPDQVSRAADLIVDYTHGYVLGEVHGSARAPWWPPLSDPLEARPDAFPATRRVLGAQAPLDWSGDFAAGLELILAGVAAIAGGSGADG